MGTVYEPDQCQTCRCKTAKLRAHLGLHWASLCITKIRRLEDDTHNGWEAEFVEPGARGGHDADD